MIRTTSASTPISEAAASLIASAPIPRSSRSLCRRELDRGKLGIQLLQNLRRDVEGRQVVEHQSLDQDERYVARLGDVGHGGGQGRLHLIHRVLLHLLQLLTAARGGLAGVVYLLLKCLGLLTE